MKVAVVGFCNRPDQYGGAQGPHYNAVQILRHMKMQGFRIDPAYVIIGKYDSAWNLCIGEPALFLPPEDFYRILNTFDHVIFVAPAPHSVFDRQRHAEQMAHVKVPTTFLIQSERESTIYIDFPIYLERHENIANIVVQSESPWEEYQDDKHFLELLMRHTIVQSSGWTQLQYLHPNPAIEQSIRNKCDIIVANSRWASWKHIDLLATLSRQIYLEWNYLTTIAGGTDDPEKARRIKFTNRYFWSHFGPYHFLQADGIVKDKRFIWNPSGFSGGRTIRRLEYSAIEGIWHGCIPILSEEICPPWMQGGHIVTFSIHDRTMLQSRAIEAIGAILSLPITSLEDMAFGAHYQMCNNINIERLMRDFSIILGL